MNKINVLDHGYLGFVEHWGSDERIIEAARMSTDKGFLGWGPTKKCKLCGIQFNYEQPVCGYKCVDGNNGFDAHDWEGPLPGDEKLLAYLYANKHSTPFEMAGVVIEVQAPIMVFREWHRHRTQSYNEMSGRYIALPDINYIPTVERLMLNSKTNKQAGTIKGAEELTEERARWFQTRLKETYDEQENLYQLALNHGVPKELARVHLPVGRYSRMRACANLRNWLAFLTLRMDVKAQWEIRQYAIEVGRIIERLYPRTWKLFIGD